MTVRQILFYAMTEAEIIAPGITSASLTDIKTRGFDAIYLEFRNTRAPFWSPRFQAAVKHVCGEARRLGLAVILDASLNHCAPDMLAHHPEMFTDSLSRRRVPVRGGRFTLETTWGDPSCRTLENAWLVRPLGAASQVEACGARCRLVSQVSEGGGCAMTRQRGGAATLQQWALDGVDEGELFVVERRRFAYANRDLGHPAQDGYLDRMCDFAAGHAVEGVVWDEPHFGFDFMEDAYPVSDRLYAAFYERFDYDLHGSLVDLWLDVDGRDSGRVRLDFAELLESQLALLENGFKRRALAHPGLGGSRPGLAVGIHRTMHEELSDDFRIGSVDYFRHTQGLTGGYTDSVFEREDSMVTMTLLARALAPLSESGEAWNNSWGFRPTAAHLDYYLRLMGCLNVRWIGHVYHGSLMFGPGYPHHPTWAGLGGQLAVHRELLGRLDGAVPECDTAVLYHWRGLADFPGNYLHQHRRDLMMACLELGLGQAALTLVDPATLAAGRAGAGRWETALGRFRRILVLWPGRLEREAWTALEQAAAAGVELLLAGPPAWFDSTGGAAGARWAALAGCEPVAREAALEIPYGASVEVAGRQFAFDPGLAVPNWRSNPENTYPDHAKAWALAGGEPVARWNGRTIGVRRGNVTTVATELPQIPGALAALWPTPPVAPAGLLAFPYAKGGERLLALCARKAEPVDGEFMWEGRRIRCRGCRHGVLRRTADGQVTVLGEGLEVVG
jgi:hypothetical protein